MLALSFDYREPVTIEEGRDLVVTAVHELVDAVNADERIRPYLAEYPFGPKRIEIRIFVQDIKGASFPSSAANVVSCCNGICRYKILHFSEKRIETVLKETLAEAEQKSKRANFVKDPC